MSDFPFNVDPSVYAAWKATGRRSKTSLARSYLKSSGILYGQGGEPETAPRVHDCRKFLPKKMNAMVVSLCPVCGRHWSTPIVKREVEA